MKTIIKVRPNTRKLKSRRDKIGLALNDGQRPIRVKDQEAEELVKNGAYCYVPKSTFKNPDGMHAIVEENGKEVII
tara:strand:- start:428 stop:655 length:228 start_codon:yes stop_codon:yes gene_type:complete